MSQKRDSARVVWRIAAYAASAQALLLAAMLVVVLSDGTLWEPATRVDYSRVPVDLRIPLWLVVHSGWLACSVLAAMVVATVAAWRRAFGKPALVALATWLILPVATAGLWVVSHWWICETTIEVSASLSVHYTSADLIPALITAVALMGFSYFPFALAAVGALVARARR